MKKKSRFRLKQSAIIAASIHLIFADIPAWAGPTGPQVVNGVATFQRPNASTLNITNSPGAIINWQGFSIGAGELTRFIQQSSSSAVLNRVVGADASQIYGQLLSNGRVFLINPAGIVVGPGAVVDTAGFVASTLNMLDADFLAGKLKFQGDANSGSIVNQGWIRTGYGGRVILVAPQIENSGLIHTPGGELILAAGQKLTITSLDLDGVQFEVRAPTDSVLNVGKLLADGGVVGVFAGTLRHSGEIRANALIYDEAGRIVLKAQNQIEVAAGSTTSADGKIGGSITIQSGQELTRVAGQVTATGSAGPGGDIRLLGDRVSVVESAVVDASGSAGGGQILVGGDFQGNNPAIQNSSNTFIGSAATLRADATRSGDGGRIIVWSDDKAQFYGQLSAQGGPEGGNGGFAEVSGKQDLIFAGSADLGAAKGKLGTLLLDPLDLFVFAGGGLDPSIIDESTDFPSNAATVSPATLAAITGNVNLFAARYMRISDPITLAGAGQGLIAQVGTWTPPAAPDPVALNPAFPNRLDINANITTAGGAVSMVAPTIQSVAASTISTTGGAISLNTSGSTIQASSLSLDAGSGAVTAISGSSTQLGTVAGGSFTATGPSFINTGAITTSGGAVTLTSSGSSIGTSNITSGGGSVSLSGSSVGTGTIDTTGGVTLSANAGSIFSTVNNSSSLTATAAFTASISSATDLNVASVTAGSSSSASLSTSNGSIRGTSAASQVKGLDVTLQAAAGTGGGIGTAATALNVDAQRTFTFSPNGTFNVLLTGNGPNRLSANVGVATSGSYTGVLTKSGGGLTMDVSATTSTVTLNNLSITSGFDQRVFSSNPDISFRVPNGALVATSVTVPTGDTVSTVSEPNGIPLNVALRSSGDLTLASYTRAAGGLAKATNISSDSGAINLGGVNASKDTVIVTGPTGITVDSLISTGNVTLTSSAGAVNAQSNSPGVEVSSSGTLTITGRGIGTGAFGNPLDLAASAITLTSTGGAAGPIGGANPVTANTQTLTINAAGGSTFNVNTGTTSLGSLTVTANPTSVGDTGVARVVTAAGTATYDFDANAGDFTFNPPASTGRNVTFTATAGDVTLGSTSLGTGNFVLSANGGGIFTGGAGITAAAVTLNAATDIDTSAALAAPGDITASTGNIALHGRNSVTTGALNTPGQLTIDGNFGCFFCSPIVSVGIIGGSSAPSGINVSGDTITVTGAGMVAGTGNITLDAGGLLTVGGAITGGSGSTITLNSGGATPFVFSSINAGNAGTVKITSSTGIRRQFGGAGITAQTLELLANSGDIHGLDSLGGATNLDLLNSANNLKLTVEAGGKVLLNAGGRPFDSIDITTNGAGPDAAPIFLANMGGGQALIVSDLGNGDFNLALNSPSIPLDFAFTANSTGIRTTGTGIVTSGGDVTLTAFGGGVNAATGGITTGGGAVTLTASGAGGITTGTIATGGGAVGVTVFDGAVTAGAITTAGGNVAITTNSATGNISLNGNLDAGAGSVQLIADTTGNISGGGAITSSASVLAHTENGEIGVTGVAPIPLAITSPTVTLTATRGLSATGNEGFVSASLNDTTTLNLAADRGFSVANNNTGFSTLSVATKGTGAGTLALTAQGGQTYSFDRPATDLFGANVANTAFEVVSVTAPAATATFTASDGILLVRGTPGGANKINVENLTLGSGGGGDIVLQGKASDPLTLSNSTQTFSASGGATADVLIRGTAALGATSSQTLSATGSININADAGGGGSVTITAPTQQFTTTGSASKMEFLGGAAAGEKVTVTATSQQRVDATSSSIDSFKLKGGTGADASVTFSHSGTGIQDFQMLGGTVTVQGGGGSNAFAKLEETGANLQRICRFVIFQGCVPVGGLQILGGSGIGAFGQVTSVGSQDIGVSSAALVKGGTGDGAYALLQAGTTQNIFGNGSLTVEGQGTAGAIGKAEVLASGAQTIDAGNIAVTAGLSNGSLARIATAGNQSIDASGITLTAKGSEAVPLSNASAIIEGNNQIISGSGPLTLVGGAGPDGSNTSDALVRNLSGSQSITRSGITINGGHQFSTAGILNPAPGGTQTISAPGGVTMTSDPDAHPDASVLFQNLASTTQTVTASNGGIRLDSAGAGTVGITSAGGQNLRSRYVEVLTTPGTVMSGATAQIAAAGNQWIHTTATSPSNPLLGNPVSSMAVVALGSGTAKIEAGGAQLLEIGYPEMMQTTGLTGALTIGDPNATGTSLAQAADQNVFAGSILVQSGSGAGSLSKLSATNTQTITTLLGGIDILGGTGANSLATIDPITQTILSNGAVALVGGGGNNADASIASGGAQTILNTNGDITLTGGTGIDADAFITTPGVLQTITTVGNVSLAAGTGAGADASIINANGITTAPFTCGVGCTLVPPPPAITSLFAETLAGNNATSQVLADQGNLTAVLAEIPPSAEEVIEFRQRIPICR